MPDERHATRAWAIRDPVGLYFGGFTDPQKNPSVQVKWRHGLCEAHLFGGNARAQAEKYIDRIKAKEYREGLIVVEVALR